MGSLRCQPAKAGRQGCCSEASQHRSATVPDVQACERADIMNIGGFSDAVINVISAFLADNNQRFVAEVEAIEL